MNFFIKSEGRPLFDMCHCQANCKKDCARKLVSEKEICGTFSDLSNICKAYEKE